MEAVLEVEEEDVYYIPLVPEAVGGKRLASSVRTSGEQEGTRGSKSACSSRSALEDALSRIANFSDVTLEGHHRWQESDSVHSVATSQDIIKEMNIPDQWKIHATLHYANNSEERIVFIRASPSERFEYVLKIMQDKSLA